MPERSHTLLLGSWLIVDKTSSSVKFERMLEYQVGLMLGLGSYSVFYWESNMLELICRGAVQRSKCCWIWALIVGGSVIMSLSSLILLNLTGSLWRFRILLIIEVGWVCSLEHLLSIALAICCLISLMFSIF